MRLRCLRPARFANSPFDGPVDLSDMLNGDYIRDHLYAPTQVVETVDDPAFATAAVPA